MLQTSAIFRHFHFGTDDIKSFWSNTGLQLIELKGRDAERQELLPRPCNSSETRGVMYRIKTFSLSCRGINAATLVDMTYLPLTSVITELYTSYGGM